MQSAAAGMTVSQGQMQMQSGMDARSPLPPVVPDVRTQRQATTSPERAT
jgi:hypothetical protein